MRRFFAPVILGLSALGLAVPHAYAQAGPVVTLLPASQTASAGEGATAVAIKFKAISTFAQPAYPDVQFDHSQLVQIGDLSSPIAGTYRAAFNTVPNLPGGTTTGTVTFRLCSDNPCTQEYPGTAQTFTYTINVTLRDWVTFQRDAGHSGYVHASYSGVVKHRWVWQPANTNFITSLATRGSAIYTMAIDPTGAGTVVSLDMFGAQRWNYPLGHVTGGGAPAIVGDKVVIPWMVTSSFNNPLTVLNASDGTVAVANLTFPAQWSQFLPLTPYGDNAYMAGGYFGNQVTNYDLAAGQASWTSNGLGAITWDGQTPAVDSQYVYYYSGHYLDAFDRITGTRLHSTADPFFSFSSYSYPGAPMLGSGGDVIAYSGASYYRPLVKFPATGAASILGADTGYNTPPAIANGVIYAADGTHLNAISEADGSILWSWTQPGYETGVNNFKYNIIVTDTLLFVSTDRYLYAVSLTDPAHGLVWSAPTPGYIAISKDNLLLVNTVLNGKVSLVAYSLK